jgi:hypothetical protein
MAPTTFERATTKIERLRSTSDVNVINALLDVLVDAVDETTDASERKADLVEALEPTLIADPDIHLNTSLLQLAKSVLSLNGIAIPDTRDPLSDRIMHGLFANEPEKLSFGMTRLKTLRDERVSQRSTGQGATAALHSNPVHQSHGSAADIQVAKSMPLRFKSSEKFTGILESSVALETLENQYDRALVELKVPENEHVMYLHHALDGPALTFYQKSIYPDPRAPMSPLNVKRVAEAYRALEEKYLNQTARAALRQKLTGMRLSDLQNADDLSKVDAIGIARERVRVLSTNGPPEYRTDNGMIDSLEFVLQNEPWSADVFAKRADVTYSFDNFCDALVSWLRAHENKNDVSHGHLGKPSTDPTRNDVAKSKILDVLYGEYSTPRYADRRNFPSRKKFPLSLPTLPKKGLCHRCHKPGHWQADCREPVSVSHLDALKARVRSEGSTSRVLYAIGAEMDAASSEAIARAEQNEALEDKDHDAAVDAIEQFFYKERDGSDGEADLVCPLAAGDPPPPSKLPDTRNNSVAPSLIPERHVRSSVYQKQGDIVSNGVCSSN